MTYSEQNMRDILSQDIQVSDEVNERLQETYQMLEVQDGRKHNYRKNVRNVAAAAVIMCCVIPSVVYASVKSDFFEGLLGNQTKQSTPALPQEVDEGKDEKAHVVVPSKEYVSVDEARAEELLGEWVTDVPIINQIGEHTISVENFVYDKNGALMYFTLSRDDGVTALTWNESTNLTKGAYFSEDTDFDFYVESKKGIRGNENIYVDTKKSTSEKLYCYSYVLWSDTLEEGDVPQLVLRRYPADRKELKETDAEQIKVQTVDLTDKGQVAVRSIDQGENGYVEYSPVSISINMAKGLGLSAEEAQDPAYLKYMEIKYKNGSSYVIYDKEKNVDNSGYTVEVDTWYKTAFNRLVDVDDIKEIIVNETSFSAF